MPASGHRVIPRFRKIDVKSESVTTTIKNRNSSLHVGSGALLEAARRIQPLRR